MSQEFPTGYTWRTHFLSNAQRDGEQYAGPYSYDEAREEVHGCPARAPAIRSLLKMVKARCAHDVKKHAEPITIAEMVQIIRWSECITPLRSLSQQMQQSQDQFLVSKYAFMHAFITTAFTLWARCMTPDYQLLSQLKPLAGVGIYALFKRIMFRESSITHLTKTRTFRYLWLTIRDG